MLNRPIATMEINASLTPINQVNPGGELTVFPNYSLNSTTLPLDSHFLLDSTQFTIVAQSKDASGVHASIRFDKPVVFGNSGYLAQIVAAGGHFDPRFP